MQKRINNMMSTSSEYRLTSTLAFICMSFDTTSCHGSIFTLCQGLYRVSSFSREGTCFRSTAVSFRALVSLFQRKSSCLSCPKPLSPSRVTKWLWLASTNSRLGWEEMTRHVNVLCNLQKSFKAIDTWIVMLTGHHTVYRYSPNIVCYLYALFLHLGTVCQNRFQNPTFKHTKQTQTEQILYIHKFVLSLLPISATVVGHIKQILVTYRFLWH